MKNNIKNGYNCKVDDIIGIVIFDLCLYKYLRTGNIRHIGFNGT
jgi:hypothetical protein